MKVTLQSTDRLVEFELAGSRVPVRVWQGETDSGTPVHAYVAYLVPEIDDLDPRHAEFEHELLQHTGARATVRELPIRMVI